MRQRDEFTQMYCQHAIPTVTAQGQYASCIVSVSVQAQWKETSFCLTQYIFRVTTTTHKHKSLETHWSEGADAVKEPGSSQMFCAQVTDVDAAKSDFSGASCTHSTICKIEVECTMTA